MDPAEYEAHGLYDPEAPNAADRLALLEWLAEQGATIEQMVDAQKRDHLTGLAVTSRCGRANGSRCRTSRAGPA